jgi:hypothetical protein
MESAGRLIGQLNRNRRLMTDEELARAAWPLAVGKKIASYTAAVALVRSRLVVEVQDMVWQRQLNTLGSQILAKLAEVVGKGLVTDLEFRPMIAPRREPQRAQTPRSAAAPAIADEADAIADPGLRRVYRVLRKKATA